MRRGRRTLLWASAGLVFAAGGTAARSEPGAKERISAAIAAVLDPIRRKHRIPGMGGAVVSRGRVIGVAATGLRVAGMDKRVTTRDRWHLGSCTKSMTATLIGRLVDQGKLSWDTTMEEAFPDLAKSMHPAWKSVTLELLLGNRGGAPEGLDTDGLWGRLRKHKGTPKEARRLLTAGVFKNPPKSAPGSQYAYSNAGFSIAGHVAETVMDEPWEDLMVKEVFAPLGMEHAGFGAPGDRLLFDEPQGHRPIAGRSVPIPPGPGADNPVAIGPANRVHCTLADWARYIALHVDGERPGQKKLALKRTTIRKLHKPLDGQAYALGWIVTKRGWGDGAVLTHAGSNTMWYAVTWLAPKRRFAVLVTCNQGGGSAGVACDEAAGALIRWYLQRKKGN